MMIQSCFNWYTILTYIKYSLIIIWQSIGGKGKDKCHSLLGEGLHLSACLRETFVQTESKSLTSK